MGAKLCPAIDDAPYIVSGTVNTALQDVTITIKAEQIYVDVIADVFRRISGSAMDNDERFQIEHSDKEATITLPNCVLDEWMDRKLFGER